MEKARAHNPYWKNITKRKSLITPPVLHCSVLLELFGNLCLQCLLRLLCRLRRVLHDELRHGGDRGVVEHQRDRQVDARQLLREGIAEQDSRVARQAALHERVVVLNVLIVANQAFCHLQDLSFQHSGIQACPDVQLHQLCFVASPRSACSSLLLRSLLTSLRHHWHLPCLHRPLLHLPLLAHLLLLLLLFVYLCFTPLHTLQLSPCHVLSICIPDRLEEIHCLFPELTCFACVPAGQSNISQEGERCALTLSDAGICKDFQCLICRFGCIRHLPVHHLCLSQCEQRTPQRHWRIQLAGNAQGILRHLG
mmetsp:Transcript_42724/g.102205  ORF Transcript_42724/g.102205 Transcript_42724/m.102205 type:complete len:309 (-) Transcript_42724:1750-2676(-)